MVLRRRMVLQSTDQDYRPLNKPELLTAMVKGYVKQMGVPAGGMVNVLVLGDAHGVKSTKTKIMEGTGTGCMKAVQDALTGLGMSLRARGYRFFDDLVGVENAQRYLNEPCIVVCFGGNTFRLNSSLHKAANLRKTLVTRVKSGQVMYVSYSAGTIVAGTRLHKHPEHTSDDPGALGGEAINWDGLGIYGDQLNPHGKDRPGKRLVDGQALFVVGNEAKIDEMPAGDA